MRTMRPGAMARWIAGAAVFVAASPAAAQPAKEEAPPAVAPAKREPSAGDLSTARTALREGLLLREKGELSAALARLVSAYDLVPTPVTGFELAKTHLMMGRVLQAHELFKKVVRMPASMEESTRSQTSRDEAARLAKEVEPRIPSLRVKLQLPAGASAVVRVDDDVITTTGPETVRAVDPGPHDVIAKAGDGPEQKVHVEVAEAETKDVSLSPQWVPPKNPLPKDGKPPEIFVRSTNPLVYIGFGVGAGLAAACGISAVVSARALDDARDKCGSQYCPPRSNDNNTAATTVSDLNFTRATNTVAAWALVSAITGLTSAVFLGVGIVGLRRPIKERVVSSSAPPRVTLQPTFGLTSAGVVGTF